MDIFHHNQFIDVLEDEWWEKAGMINFTPTKKAYRADPKKAHGKNILMISLKDVTPLKREKAFMDSEEFGTAESRVLRILRWIINDTPIEPIEVVLEPTGSEYKYSLFHGAHRFYCSMAVGFSHVPATTKNSLLMPQSNSASLTR